MSAWTGNYAERPVFKQNDVEKLGNDAKNLVNYVLIECFIKGKTTLAGHPIRSTACRFSYGTQSRSWKDIFGWD